MGRTRVILKAFPMGTSKSDETWSSAIPNARATVCFVMAPTRRTASKSSGVANRTSKVMRNGPAFLLRMIFASEARGTVLAISEVLPLGDEELCRGVHFHQMICRKHVRGAGIDLRRRVEEGKIAGGVALPGIMQVE